MKKIKAISYILILGLILRLITINQSFWLDEATSGMVVRNYSVGEIMGVFARADFHPPLYYLILKAWSGAVGTGEVGLRLLSVMAGLVTIYVVYLIGKEMGDRSLGILAALLMAVAPLHVYYSQEARMYALAAMWVTIAVYFFIKVCGKSVKQGEWIGFSASLALGLLTDYTVALVLPVFWVAAWRTQKKRKWRRKFVLAHGLLLAAAVVWWPVLREQLVNGLSVKETAGQWWRVLGKTSVKNILLIAVKMMIGRIGFESKWLYGLVVLAAGGGYSLILRGAAKRWKKYRLWWWWLIIPVITGIGIGFFVSILAYFRFLFILPAFCVLVAAGLMEVKEKYFLPVVAIVLLINFGALATYYKNPRFQREDWRGVVETVAREAEGKRARVVFANEGQMEGYRYYSPNVEAKGPGGLEEGLDQVWLMRYVWDIFDPGDSVRKRVEEIGYEKKAEYNFNGVVVWKYENRN